MSFSDKKLEIAIAGAVLVMMGGMGYLFKSPVQKALSQDLVFEMPRPKSLFASLFDLSGREVERNYKNPFVKKDSQQKPQAQAPNKALPTPQQAAVAKKTAAKKKANDKKKKMEVQVVQESPRDSFGQDSESNEKAAQRSQNQVAAQDQSVGEDSTDTDRMTADQWRALLRAQPTQENVQKLVQALANNQIDQNSYYSIVMDLLSSNQPEVQKLGVYALGFSYSARAFSIASQVYDQLAPEAQQDAYSYMMSYATKGRLSVLQGVLESGNATTVELATQVVIAGYQQAAQGGTQAPPRGSRGDGASNSLASYSQFVPTFQRLAQSGDAAIAALASQALSQIQVSVAAL